MTAYSSEKKFLYYFLAIVGSLSSAGASMTLIALSASLYSFDQEGTASSSIYVLNYFGIGLIGFVGGWVLQRFTAIALGITGALISAIIVFYLASLSQIHPFIGLPAIFLIFLINGIDHPNNLRFFNEVLEDKEKLTFFSIKEGAGYVLGLVAPTLAALIIKFSNTEICFMIDGCTYLLSCLPWIILKKKQNSIFISPPVSKPNWFIGFQSLVKDRNIRLLNISRLLNNLAYATWIASFPFFLAKIAEGDKNIFAQEQGIATSLVSGGFIFATLIGTLFAKKYKLMTTMLWAASVMGFIAVTLLACSLFQKEMMYIGAFLAGAGAYCFRLLGITIGQSITPKTILGAVIIAGDTIVRGWSFFISLFVLGIFHLHETLELPLPFLGSIISLLSMCSLISPLLVGNMVKDFVSKHQKEELVAKS